MYFCVGMFRMINIFAGCSGFGWEWVIWKFSFKSAISSVITGRCFGGCR